MSTYEITMPEHPLFKCSEITPAKPGVYLGYEQDDPDDQYPVLWDGTKWRQYQSGSEICFGGFGRDDYWSELPARFLEDGGTEVKSLATLCEDARAQGAETRLALILAFLRARVSKLMSQAREISEECRQTGKGDPEVAYRHYSMKAVETTLIIEALEAGLDLDLERAKKNGWV